MPRWDLSFMVRDPEATGTITIDEIPVDQDGYSVLACNDDTSNIAVEISDWCGKVLKPYQLRNLLFYLKEACDELPPEDLEHDRGDS